MSHQRMRIVRSGTWLYDGSVRQPVDIVGLNFDHSFGIGEADGRLEPGERPEPMGPDRWLYYVRFRRAGERSLPTWVDGPGHTSVDEAAAQAEDSVLSPIAWRVNNANPLWKTLAVAVSLAWCALSLLIAALLQTMGVSDAEPESRPAVSALFAAGGLGVLSAALLWVTQGSRRRALDVWLLAGSLTVTVVGWSSIS